MNAWFDALSTLERTLFAIALFSTLVFAIQVVFSLFGIGEGDEAVPGGDDLPFGDVFTIRNGMAFLMGFSWGGLTAQDWDLRHPFLVTLAGLVLGCLFVDDWYQAHAAGWRRGQAGAKPLYSDSEVITLLLLMDFLPFPEETQFLGFVRANHPSLFPQLLSQSQFNRRARRLWPWVEALRRHWADVLGAIRASLYLLDTKPLPVVGYTRCKDRSDFAATADYGVCASRNLKYFGYKGFFGADWHRATGRPGAWTS